MGRSPAVRAEGPAAGRFFQTRVAPSEYPPVITCPKCGKENQDHYKFCLGCGAELPRGGAAKPFSSNTPPHGVPAARASAPAPRPAAPGPAAAAAPMPAPAPAAAPAPQCGHGNVPGNRFCASCGYNLSALSGAQAVPQAAVAAPGGGGQPIVLTAL